MSMLIKDMMTTRPVSVQMDDPIENVKKIFESTGFHHLLVLEKRTLVGIISDRDLLKTLSPYLGTDAEMVRDTATLEKRAHQIMTRTPITVKPEQGIYDALELFLRYKLSCLPVVNDERRPVGILSWRDIFRTVYERRQKKLAKLEKEKKENEKDALKARLKEEKEKAALAEAALKEVAEGRACAIPMENPAIAGMQASSGLSQRAGAH